MRRLHRVQEPMLKEIAQPLGEAVREAVAPEGREQVIQQVWHQLNKASRKKIDSIRREAIMPADEA